MKFPSALRFFAFILPLGFLFIALCCKDGSDPPKPVDPPVTPQPVVYPDSLAGIMQVQFSNHVDNIPLELETRQYVSPAQDTFTVEEMSYYISNVKLKNTQTGEIYAEKDSYHLIDEKKNKKSFTLKGIPVKGFDQLEFSIGVDPVRNASTDNVGDLDTNIGMSWTWNTGYIFMRFNGKQVSKTFPNPKGLTYHAGENANYKTLTFPLKQTVTFAKNKPYTANIKANVNGLFRSPHLIDFEASRNIMMNPGAAKLAENYASGMFTFEGVVQQ